MSGAEELKEDIETALKKAVVGDADLDDIEVVLDEAQSRVDALRTMEQVGA